jgi:hypothetical protein
MNCIFPEFSGVRCLMMPYIQGEPASVPSEFAAYEEIIRSVFIRRGDIGYLTIDESLAHAGEPHRGARAKFGRALHTEAGLLRGTYGWGGGPSWGGKRNVTLDRETRVLIASNTSASCAIWDVVHADTSEDGDIGDRGALYPYEAARLLAAGEVADIGILTPHESLPIKEDTLRQFLRIVGSGVHGREPYFTENPLVCPTCNGTGWLVADGSRPS